MTEGMSTGSGDLSLLRLTNVVLRFRAVIAGASFAGALLIGLVTFLAPRDFSSIASFTPQSRQLPSSLSGLASQFGLGLPATEMNQSPAFYADLLQSRAVLEGVVDSAFSVKVNGKDSVGTLMKFFGSRGQTPALQREAAVVRLRETIGVAASPKTGIVTLKVTTRFPVLSKAVAERFLELLNAFNLRNRQSQASAERKFTERRAGEVRRDLKAAEDVEQEFLQRNRDFRSSPQLTFAYDRLAREVSLQQQVYATLAQALEQAKIEEVRDTPVITVVEPPQVPVRPDARGTMRKMILGLLLGGMCGLCYALWREFLRRADSAGRSELAEFLQLRSDLWLNLRDPLRFTKRTAGHRPATG